MTQDDPYTDVKFMDDYRQWTCACDPFKRRSTSGNSSNIHKHKKTCKSNALIKRIKHHPEPPTLSQKEFDQLVLNAVIECNISFSTLENDTFRALLLKGRGRSKFKLMSRRELCRQMSNEYEKMKVVLKKSISKATSRLSITLDLWTDKASRPFLAVTGHYFDQSYKLKAPLLSLKWLPKSSQVPTMVIIVRKDL